MSSNCSNGPWKLHVFPGYHYEYQLSVTCGCAEITDNDFQLLEIMKLVIKWWIFAYWFTHKRLMSASSTTEEESPILRWDKGWMFFPKTHVLKSWAPTPRKVYYFIHRYDYIPDDNSVEKALFWLRTAFLNLWVTTVWGSHIRYLHYHHIHN